MEKIKQAGFDPMEYIRFYNLRSYDRINSGKKMRDVEKKAGVKYDEARSGFDQRFGHAGDSENYGKGHKGKKQQNSRRNQPQRAIAS